MNTVLVPGVSWPHPGVQIAQIKKVQLKRGGHKDPVLAEEIKLIREMRAQGKSILDLQHTFRRGKVTVVAIIFGTGRFAGYA